MRLIAPVALAPVPPLVVTWAMLGSVLSFRGLALWAGLGTLAVWAVVAVFGSSGRRLWALAATAMAPLALAWLAEVAGGNTSGPLTRATLLTSGLVAVATLLTFTAWPRLALIPLLALLCSALALGAASSALAWVGAWAVALGASLLIVGPYDSRDLRARARLSAVALLLGVGGGVAVLGAVVSAPLLGPGWTIHGAGVEATPPGSEVAASPAPSAFASASATSSAPEQLAAATPAAPPPPVASAASATVPADAPLDSTMPWLQLFLIVLLVLVALWVLGHVLRVVAVWAQWRWRRHRLRQGTAHERIVGAWTWARLQRARGGIAVPAWASPDVAESWAFADGDPSLARLAHLTSPIAFDPQADASMIEAGNAWECADLVMARARGTGWRQRWAWAASSPRTVERVMPLTATRRPPPHCHASQQTLYMVE